MWRDKLVVGALLFLVWNACAAFPSSAQQIGKFVPIPAGSDADHLLTEIQAAADPAQKLALIDKFAASAQGDMAILADDAYVNYYIAAKNYDRALEYGDKLFALDPDNFSNAINMVRAAREKGDVDKLFAYGEKAAQILQRYKEKPALAGMKADDWEKHREQVLQDAHDSATYVEQLLFDEAARERILTAAPRVLARYSWPRAARETLDVLLSASSVVDA